VRGPRRQPGTTLAGGRRLRAPRGQLAVGGAPSFCATRDARTPKWSSCTRSLMTPDQTCRDHRDRAERSERSLALLRLTRPDGCDHRSCMAMAHSVLGLQPRHRLHVLLVALQRRTGRTDGGIRVAHRATTPCGRRTVVSIHGGIPPMIRSGNESAGPRATMITETAGDSEPQQT